MSTCTHTGTDGQTVRSQFLQQAFKLYHRCRQGSDALHISSKRGSLTSRIRNQRRDSAEEGLPQSASAFSPALRLMVFPIICIHCFLSCSSDETKVNDWTRLGSVEVTLKACLPEVKERKEDHKLK